MFLGMAARGDVMGFAVQAGDGNKQRGEYMHACLVTFSILAH